MFKLPVWLLQLGTLVALVAAWGVASKLMNNPSVLPSPLACINAIGTLIARGTLIWAAQASFSTLLIGSGICIIVVIPVAMLLALSRRTAAFIQPMVRFISSVPAIALIPLFIVWFGFNQKAVYATLLYTAAIPLFFSVLTGVQKIPPVYASSLRPLGASTSRIIRDVYLPGAIPGIVVGIRLTLSYGWRAVIAGELIVGSNGLGRLLAQARASNQVDQIIAVMIVICLLFLVIDRLLLNPWDQVISSRWKAL
ncbi:ABC transporter permease [Microvirga zambiensis]|uniref:ABC transporter permease n=1 Tax=Microvirga zambiensis TaxID=1402137 RepID=UPI00191E84B9|nr:ABC transporter permease [Microvirga zambiensis]